MIYIYILMIHFLSLNCHQHLDDNGDGILSWEDFNQLAEKYTKLQRRGKVEKEVFDRWKAIFEKWWTQLTSFADFNEVCWCIVSY